jgi:hypothetical protein
MMSKFLGAMTAALLLSGPAFAASTSGMPHFMYLNDGGGGGGADFRAPESGPGPIMEDPSHKRGGNNDNGQPTFRIADLSNPILLPWTRAALKKMNDKIAAGGSGFSPQVSCKPLGVPAFLLHPGQPVMFIQTAKEVLIVWPPNHEVRHIYLTDKHSAHVNPSWYGESIGHYENGDTLVVDTIGLSDKTYVDNYRTPHTTELHVVERFRINPDQKGLTVDVTVEDPGAFTMPWHAVQIYRRQMPGPLSESNCAENTTNFFNYDIDPIPEADKPDF